MNYRILLDDTPVGASDWLPVAQAAWDRAARDRDAAQHGGEAVLLIGGRVVAAVQPRMGEGHPWPLDDDVGLRDVAHAVQMLARAAGVDAAALAEAMSDHGLPTTRARLKSVSTMQDGRRAATSAAELVVMCYAAASVLRNDGRS